MSWICIRDGNLFLFRFRFAVDQSNDTVSLRSGSFHGRHTFQQRRPKMIVLSEQLRKLNSTLLQLDVQVATESVDDLAYFSVKWRWSTATCYSECYDKHRTDTSVRADGLSSSGLANKMSSINTQ